MEIMSRDTLIWSEIYKSWCPDKATELCNPVPKEIGMLALKGMFNASVHAWMGVYHKSTVLLEQLIVRDVM